MDKIPPVGPSSNDPEKSQGPIGPFRAVQHPLPVNEGTVAQKPLDVDYSRQTKPSVLGERNRPLRGVTAEVLNQTLKEESGGSHD